MRPRVARIFDASWMACAKSPVISVSAATNRLPKLWPFRAVAAAEAMREELRQQIFFFAERDHAVAQVAGRQHVEVLAQAARRAAVVGHRDHGRQVGRSAQVRRRAGPGTANVAAQSAQQRGKAGAAANGHNAQRTDGRTCLARRKLRWSRIQRTRIRRQIHRMLQNRDPTEFQDTATR